MIFFLTFYSHLFAVVGYLPKHYLSGDEFVTHGFGDISSRNAKDKRLLAIRHFNVSHLHRIDELATVKMFFRPTYQRFDAMVGMLIQKTTPIIGGSFPNRHIFQVVNRSLIERRNMVDIGANATVKESIFIHIFYPS